jgi:hypothetical protein
MRASCAWIGGVAFCALLAGCQTPQQAVSAKEDMLAAAGFTVRPADTPARETALHTLPPDKFVTHTHNGNLVYVMADPLVCNCLYIGNQQAWDRYKNELFTQHIADEQQMTATMYQDRWDWGGWDWGPWGPGWWGGPGWW